jgi:hypothetical protein
MQSLPRLRKFSWLLLVLSVQWIACNRTGKEYFRVDVSGVAVPEVRIRDYGKALFEADRDNLLTVLKKLQGEYGIFLDGSLDDTLNFISIRDFVNDPVINRVYQDYKQVFGNKSSLEKGLTEALRHYRYYVPGGILPQVYLFISGFDLEYPVACTGPELVIAADLFLGASYPEYPRLGLPAYKIRRMSPEYILPACMEEICLQHLDYGRVGNTLLDKMISEGKLLLFAEAMMPEVSDTIIIGYTQNQLRWVRENESNIWAFYIGNKMLYSTDTQVINKFILDAPFTPFFSNDSPGRIGCWTGWQILRSYMSRQKDADLLRLLGEYDSQKILDESGYRPRKR